jgi:hypothetical protein
LVVKSEGRISVGRPRRGWKNGIRMDLRKTGWEDVDWVQFTWDGSQWLAVVYAAINLGVLAPRNYIY